MVKIGVFDSGVGGLSVANAIRAAIPDAEVLLREDKQHLPYGTKTPEQLVTFVLPILERLVQEGCDAIVIACNSVTTTVISDLRAQIAIPLVGMEPMVKPAAEITKTNCIAVLATPTTLGSNRYQWLKSEYCKNVAILEPDCSDWARMIEENDINHETIEQTISEVINSGADVIVLGCTHYHWIRQLIINIARERAVVIQPEQPVIQQLKRVIGIDSGLS